MPVVDHPVHERTKIAASYKYGCYDLPASTGGVMSDRCRYDMSLQDPACSGCCHIGKGEKYAAEVARVG